MKWHYISLILFIFYFSVYDARGETCFSTDEPIESQVNNVDISAGLNRFGFSLMGNLSDLVKQENLLISPYSVWSVLTLALAGAGGDTKTELQRVLGLPESKTLALKEKDRLEYQLTGKANYDPAAPAFKSVNKLYADRFLPIRNCIRRLIFDIEIVNFGDTALTAQKINRDVEKATKGEIRNLVNSGDIAGGMIVLLNAVYFQGNWLIPFDPQDTRDRTFTITHKNGREESIMHPMMVSVDFYRWGMAEELGAEILKVPYQGDSVSMYIILPSKSGSLQNTIDRLTADRFASAISNTRSYRVKLNMPKFELKTKVTLEMIHALQNMGLRDIFDRSRADFSDLSRVNLSINKVIHEAKVKVDELGTLGVAATAGITLLMRPASFDVNRPFVFVIYNHKERATLFTGIVRDPRE